MSKYFTLEELTSFNSRTPGGVRLLVVVEVADGLPVSIHAPREGCDTPPAIAARGRSGFNSRTPGGVRLITTCRLSLEVEVSIHAPREGCDEVEEGAHLVYKVSIHALREGCDQPQHQPNSSQLVFQFTHPGRGATGQS